MALTGGGARAAYQVGFLRFLARQRPDFHFSILTGVSAGAINAAFLANHPGPFPKAVEDLTQVWLDVTPDQVFRIDPLSLFKGILRWGARLSAGGSAIAPKPRGLVDTEPLRDLLTRALRTRGELPGVARNLERGELQALALTTVDYATGRTVTWVQGCDIELWERPMRRSVKTRITIEHVMASSALPLLFPAVQLGDSWYGDGGVRLAAPLAPAIHLGADCLIAISTRYRKDTEEANQPTILNYPPPAQVAGVLMNAIFLDLLDHDTQRLERINRLVEKLPPGERYGLRPVKLLVLRPSQDLGRMAGEFEVQLPRTFRFLTRGLGTRDTRSPDLLSMLLFQPDFVKRMIDIGESDAEAHKSEIAAVLDGS